jgi:hypothetical protein
VQNVEFDLGVLWGCNWISSWLNRSEDLIKEVLRICKPKGKIFITVNSFESKYYLKITSVPDITIRYKNKDVFYHLYKEQELTDICLSLDCKIIKRYRTKFWYRNVKTKYRLIDKIKFIKIDVILLLNVLLEINKSNFFLIIKCKWKLSGLRGDFLKKIFLINENKISNQL